MPTPFPGMDPYLERPGVWEEVHPQAVVYLFTIRDPIPDIPVPLQPGDAEPSLALNQLLHDVYDRAGYDLTVDYRQSPPPPQMPAQDVQWMQQLLHPQGLQGR
jgi:hypothetical protein